jgi:hypothetical protein
MSKGLPWHRLETIKLLSWYRFVRPNLPANAPVNVSVEAWLAVLVHGWNRTLSEKIWCQL